MTLTTSHEQIKCVTTLPIAISQPFKLKKRRITPNLLEFIKEVAFL